jgi:thiol-disulfide isomerase/thioredoxin
MRSGVELEKMRKESFFVAVAIATLAFASGCDDAAQLPQSPAQQQPAAGKPLSPVDSPPPRHEIVRGGLRFIDGYQAGLDAAAAQRKPMLLFFTARWCTYCHQLAAEAFTDAAVVDLSERFVCVLVDADREPNVCAYFRVGSYPTIQFVSSRGQLLNRLVGKHRARELARQMNAALQTLARMPANAKGAY